MKPIHIRYRPETLDDFVGNRSTVKALESVLNRESGIPHAFLFTGPRGTGKTTLGRIIKNSLGCSDFDFNEIDSAGYEGGVNFIRDLRRKAFLAPVKGDVKVYLIDECHKLSKTKGTKGDAQTALLKILEDTPDHVYFILATTDPQDLLETLKSRCHSYTTRLLPVKIISAHLKSVVRKERKLVPLDVLDRIATDSLGSMRAAMVTLDKIIDMNPADQLEAIDQIKTEENKVIDLYKALMKGDPWSNVTKILKGIDDQEPEQIRRSILGLCNWTMLNKHPDAKVAFDIYCEFEKNFFDSGKAGVTAACFELCGEIPF